MTFCRCLPRVFGGLTLLGLLLVPPPAGAQASTPGREAEAAALDRKVMAEVKDHAEVMANLTYLCDTIGPRLTGSKNLKRANEWAAEKMTAYGLSDVHQEPWAL